VKFFARLQLKSRRALLFAGLLLILLSACGGNDGATNPGNGIGGEPPLGYTYSPPAAVSDGWTVGDAGSQGISVQSLEEMMAAVGRGEYPVIDSVAIASQGTLVFDETIRTRLDEKDQWVGNGDLSLHAQFSSSKSIARLSEL
jgi:hypothetical protein